MHGGNHVKVKYISLGKADNPFSVAQLNFRRKSQANSSISLTVSLDVEEQNDLEIVSGNALDLKHSDQSILPVSLTVSLDVPDMSLVPTTNNTWYIFLTESISMISSIKEKSNEFLNMATSVLTSELTSGHNENNNIIDKLLDHDPEKREQVQSSSQRNYLLSLGHFNQNYQDILSTSIFLNLENDSLIQIGSQSIHI
ncbi:hypothetical protein QTP88_003546 [Uroleucon formosanum]